MLAQLAHQRLALRELVLAEAAAAAAARRAAAAAAALAERAERHRLHPAVEVARQPVGELEDVGALGVEDLRVVEDELDVGGEALGGDDCSWVVVRRDALYDLGSEAQLGRAPPKPLGFGDGVGPFSWTVIVGVLDVKAPGTACASQLWTSAAAVGGGIAVSSMVMEI